MKGVSCVVRSVGSTCTRPREEDHPARRVAGLRVTGRPRSPLPGYSPGTVLGRATCIIPAHRPPVSRLRPICLVERRFLGHRDSRGVRAGLAVAERRRV